MRRVAWTIGYILTVACSSGSGDGGTSNGGSGGSDCSSTPCFAPAECVQQCGDSPVDYGCCGCPSGWFDVHQCATDAGSDAGDASSAGGAAGSAGCSPQACNGIDCGEVPDGCGSSQHCACEALSGMACISGKCESTVSVVCGGSCSAEYPALKQLVLNARECNGLSCPSSTTAYICAKAGADVVVESSCPSGRRAAAVVTQCYGSSISSAHYACVPE